MPHRDASLQVIIAGNYITDSPTECAGIRAMGRDILIERNWVEGVSVKDSGGIYLGVATSHAAAFRGRVVQHNYVSGAVKGIYIDDGTSGTTVVENVVVGSDKCAIHVSGGRDNIITRNVLDGPTSYQFHLDSRYLGWALTLASPNPNFSQHLSSQCDDLGVAVSKSSHIINVHHPTDHSTVLPSFLSCSTK